VQSRNIGWFQNPFGSNVKYVPSEHKMELNYLNFNGALKGKVKEENLINFSMYLPL
jgi:hypothetical protein